MSTPRLDRTLWVLIAGFAILLAAVSGSAWVAMEQQHASALVRHTLVVQRPQLRVVLSRLQDAARPVSAAIC